MEDRLENKFIEEVNQHIGIAHKVCHIYFQDTVEREDTIQEMLYQLWRSYPAFRRNSRFSTWMYRVCFNTAITCLNKSKRNKNEAVSYNHYNLIDQSDDDYEEKVMILHQLIESLSPLNKSIILLYLEGIRYDEISTITGLSKNNVSVRVVRIKNELKKFKHQIF